MTTLLPLLLLLVSAFQQAVATTTSLSVVTLPARGEISLNMTPSGKVDLRRDGPSTRVRVEVDKPPAPASFGEPFHTFVVWAVSPEGYFENIAELTIQENKARSEASTHYEQLAVLVTAEPHYLVARPSGAVAFVNSPPRAVDTRRINITVQTGLDDYSNLRVAPGTGLAQQARAAFVLAGLAGAERFAEAEYRAARAALATMEEMLPRVVPPDILFQSTNEAIRRSHQAAVVARQSAQANAIETLRQEAAAIRQERDQLASRISQLEAQQKATADQLNRVRADLESARREQQTTAQERDQAQARARAVERQVQEAQQLRTETDQTFRINVRRAIAELGQVEEKERESVIRLPDAAFDPRQSVLTAKYRDVLGRLAGILRLSGSVASIRVEAHWDGTGTEAANLRTTEAWANATRQALLDMGIAPERVQAHGLGSRQRLGPSNTEQSRAANRRIDITVTFP